jgi:hypothetical protein
LEEAGLQRRRTRERTREKRRIYTGESLEEKTRDSREEETS